MICDTICIEMNAKHVCKILRQLVSIYCYKTAIYLNIEAAKSPQSLNSFFSELHFPHYSI